MDKFNKAHWMKPNEIDNELKNKNILLDKELQKSEKAIMLGFKKQRVCIDDTIKMAYVNGDELYLNLKKLIESRIKYPLGFDFYFWGHECWKRSLPN